MPQTDRRRRMILVTVLAGAGGLRADEPLRIDSYVQIVLNENPAGRAARALEESASAESLAARLFPDPSLEVSLGRARPATGGTDRTTETGFALSQSVPWLPARSASIEAADHAAEARRAEATATGWSLAVDARIAFYRLLQARALVEIARDAHADSRSLLDLISRRTALGETREVDRIKSRVEWLKQQVGLRLTEREAAAAEATLRTLAVSPLPRPLVVDGELPRRPDIADTLRVAATARIQSSPGLLQARAEAARASALLTSARRSRVPDLGLSLFRQNELDRDSYGIALGVVVPVWNARRGEVARAAADARLRGAEADRLKLTLFTELETRLTDLDSAAAQTSALTSEVLPAAAESLRLARLLFEEGETSLLDLLDAQRTARDARREEIRARFELAVALSELQRLLGPEGTTGR